MGKRIKRKSSEFVSSGLNLAVCALNIKLANARYSFTKGDHPSMVNDYRRLRFYDRAIQRAISICGPECSVLEIGAGSGVLSMLAARSGAAHVFAVEADPESAALARLVVSRNRRNSFPSTNITIKEGYSRDIQIGELPHGRKVDILISEILGNEFFDENVLDIVPDARDRLLKQGGTLIPAGGCHCATLVEAHDFESMFHTGKFEDLDLRGLTILRDPATKIPLRGQVQSRTDRICMTEVDFLKDNSGLLKASRGMRVQVTQGGFVNAALLDFDIWSDAFQTDILSTSMNSEDFHTSSWMPVLQAQQEFNEQWQIAGKVPRPLAVKPGDWLELVIQYFKQAQDLSRSPNIFAYLITRHVSYSSSVPAWQPALPKHAGNPAFAAYVRAGLFAKEDVLDANKYDLLLASDMQRNSFYKAALIRAISALNVKSDRMSVLDCSGGFGIPSMSIAKHYGVRIDVVAKSEGHASIMKELAKKHGIEQLIRTVSFLSRTIKAAYDIIILEPPSMLQPLEPYLSPFFLRTSPGSSHRLKKHGMVVPTSLCLEVGVLQSAELAMLYSIPGGRSEGLDFEVINEEAQAQGLLEKHFVAERTFGDNFIGNPSLFWLATPKCLFEVDMKSYLRGEIVMNQTIRKALSIRKHGKAHALGAYWTACEGAGLETCALNPRSGPLGRQSTWQTYVQPLASPNTTLSALHPLDVLAGDTLQVEVKIFETYDDSENPRLEFALGLIDKYNSFQHLEL